MPEDSFLECISAIAETMKETGWVGEWYGECFRVKYFLLSPYIAIVTIKTTRLVDLCGLSKFLNPKAQNGPHLREMILSFHLFLDYH